MTPLPVEADALQGEPKCSLMFDSESESNCELMRKPKCEYELKRKCKLMFGPKCNLSAI